MIVKRSMRGAGQGSSFAKLADYMLDKKQGGEKVAGWRLTHCDAPTLELAVKEIEATQSLNRRSAGDKTYHLIVSFAAGDQPTPAQMAEIEDDLCGAIGLSDHQRFSVVHNDTDHLHIHIAINKVHPQSLRNVEPYYDKKQLDQACVWLEEKHGLTQVNHTPNWQRSRGVANDDIAAHRGEQSFQGWLSDHRAELVSILDAAVDWKGLTEGIAKYGVVLRPRGAGLVFSDRDKPLFTKASGVDLRFSMAALEDRFGAYPGWQNLDTSGVKAEHRYAGVVSSNALYQQYRQEADQLAAQRRECLAEERSERGAAFRGIRMQARAERTAVLDSGRSAAERRAAYSLIKMQTLAELAATRDTFKARRHSLFVQTRPLSWQDFLMREAEQGSDEALAMLRQRQQGQDKAAAYIAGSERTERAAYTFTNLRYTVNKWGHVSYRLRDGSALIDRGGRIDIEKPQGLARGVALDLALEKYGSRLSLTGGQAFIEAMIQEAAQCGRQLVFEDAGQQARLEALRGKADPVARYIAERNGTAGQVNDLLPHVRMAEDFIGEGVWRGVRRLDAGRVTVGLFEADGVIQVRTLGKTEAGRYQKARIGQRVTVRQAGREKAIKSGLKR